MCAGGHEGRDAQGSCLVDRCVAKGAVVLMLSAGRCVFMCVGMAEVCSQGGVWCVFMHVVMVRCVVKEGCGVCSCM